MTFHRYGFSLGIAMTIATRTTGDILVVDIDGRLDTQTSGPALEELLLIVKSGRDKVLLNLAKLEYLSSAGLRVILQTAKKLQSADGHLKLCHADGLVKEVMRTSGFDSLINVYETEQDACGDF